MHPVNPALIIAPANPGPVPAVGAPPVVHFAALRSDLYYEAFGKRIKITLTQAQRDRLEPIIASKGLADCSLSLLDLIKRDSQEVAIGAYDDDDDDIQALKQLVAEIMPSVVSTKRISPGSVAHDDAPSGFVKTGGRLKSAEFNEDVLKKAIQRTPVAGVVVADFSRAEKIEKIESYNAANFLMAKIEQTLLAMKSDLEGRINDRNVPEDQKRLLRPQLKEITKAREQIHSDRFAVNFGVTHTGMNDLNHRMTSARNLIVTSQPGITKVSQKDLDSEERYSKDLAIMDQRTRLGAFTAAEQLQIPVPRLADMHHALDRARAIVAPVAGQPPVTDMIARMPRLECIRKNPVLAAQFTRIIGNPFQAYSNDAVARRNSPAAVAAVGDDALIAALRPAPIQPPIVQPAVGPIQPPVVQPVVAPIQPPMQPAAPIQPPVQPAAPAPGTSSNRGIGDAAAGGGLWSLAQGLLSL